MIETGEAPRGYPKSGNDIRIKLHSQITTSGCLFGGPCFY